MSVNARSSLMPAHRTELDLVVGQLEVWVLDDPEYAGAGRQAEPEVVLSGVSPRRSESEAVRAALAERCEAVVLVGSQLASRDIAELARRPPTARRGPPASGVCGRRRQDRRGRREERWLTISTTSATSASCIWTREVRRDRPRRRGLPVRHGYAGPGDSVVGRRPHRGVRIERRRADPRARRGAEAHGGPPPSTTGAPLG
jgi:hypothetical protein